ncbi:MAG: 50S ribosomal protein L19 [Candidatus Hydrogenedentes bacterium]|nr:50S ribosomal protein L19 [Candidatus Hydrogenedentota bacterium]
MNVLDEIGRSQMKPKDQVPQFRVGDTVRVHFRIVEGEKERVQIFEGVVIGRKGGEGPLARFTVRRLSYNEGVERVFPLHSPRVEAVEVIREGRVRRAKLHYLRERSGKAARVRAKGRATGQKAAVEEASSEGAENEVETAESEGVESDVAADEEAKTSE